MTTSAPLVPEVTVPSPVPPSAPWYLALRVLLLVGVVAAAVSAALQPAQRTVDDLLRALDAGEVATLTIQRPVGESTSGHLVVRWTGDGRAGQAEYAVDLGRAGDGLDDQDEVDEGLAVLAAAADSPRDVEVRQVEGFPPSPAWTAPLPLSVLVLVPLAAGLGMLVMLMFGPEPRYATRWAWFWLVVYAWPVWIAYLLLEPTPAWSRRLAEPQPRRLTGGWALLAAIVLGPVLMRGLTGG